MYEKRYKVDKEAGLLEAKKLEEKRKEEQERKLEAEREENERKREAEKRREKEKREVRQNSITIQLRSIQCGIVFSMFLLQSLIIKDMALHIKSKRISK